MKKNISTAEKKRGQILVAVVVMLVVLATLVPLMVYYAQREAAWTAKQAQNTTAFHMAEVGTEKAALILTLSSATWTNLQNGITLANYNFDTTFVDVSSGTYAISMTSGPLTGEVTVISIGRDPLKRETRAIQIIYSEGGVTSAVYANGITATGGVTIHWGPIMSLAGITLSGSANQCYPQKYAVGAISTSGSSACHDTWSATQTPCTDNTEWWAYNCSPGVPPAPSFTFTTYKTQAQAAACPTSSGFASGASPSGSCYWPVGQNPSFSNPIMTSSKTIYVEGNMSMNNGFLWGDVLVMGNVSFTGGGRGAYTIPDSFTTGIPSTAWRQYQTIDTTSVAQYYGDAGYQSLNATFQFGMNGNPSQQIGTRDGPAVRGFLYCGGNFSASGSTALHGVVYSPSGISGSSGGFTVYYDDGVASRILTNATLTRLSWQDSLRGWPAALP